VAKLLEDRFPEVASTQPELVAHHYLSGGRPLPGEVVDHIVAKADGVPLYVEELTKAILGSGVIEARGDAYVLRGALAQLHIPETLQDSLMARLDRAPRLREVAQLGSVLGREFAYDMISALAGIEEEMRPPADRDRSAATRKRTVRRRRLRTGTKPASPRRAGRRTSKRSTNFAEASHWSRRYRICTSGPSASWICKWRSAPPCSRPKAIATLTSVEPMRGRGSSVSSSMIIPASLRRFAACSSTI
jgi:hypothetical protein